MPDNNNPADTAEILDQVEDFLAVWFKVRQTIQGLNAGRSQQMGLSITQFMVLAILEESGDGGLQTITSLATRLNLDPATVLRSVDSLEKRGLVQRQRATKDRRVVYIELTGEGRQIQARSFTNFKDRLALIFSAMSPEGRQALVRGFQEFAAAAQKPDGPTDSE